MFHIFKMIRIVYNEVDIRQFFKDVLYVLVFNKPKIPELLSVKP